MFDGRKVGKAENGIGLGCSGLRMFCRLIDMNTYKLGGAEVWSKCT